MFPFLEERVRVRVNFLDFLSKRLSKNSENLSEKACTFV